MGEYRHGYSSRYSKMRSILIINPNSTEQMTDGLKPLVDALQFKDVNICRPQQQSSKLTVPNRLHTSISLHRLARKASTMKRMLQSR